MIAQWTPSTEDVRTAWFGLTGNPDSFDKWLTDVKAQAWNEGHSACYKDTLAPNPYWHGEN